MSTLNKLKKLRRMSGGEIRTRVAAVMSQRRERREWKSATDSEVDPNRWDVTSLLQRCVQLIPGASETQISQIKSNFPATYRDISNLAKVNAERILEQRWCLLGHPFDLTGRVDWHTDPRTGYQWQKTFYVDLPLYNLEGDTDIKYPWELSRHQFLCELAKNSQLNGCQRSAGRTRELMLDWIGQNPLYEGVNWTSALEVAMRVMSWIWTLAHLADWDGWSQEDLHTIASSLEDHGRYLESNFSYFSSPYNHLIGEATGLLYVAAVLPEHQRPEAWVAQATNTLAKSGPDQFYCDDFCVEQAVGYHYYTLGFMLLASGAAKQCGQPLDVLSSTIHDALVCGTKFRRPDGTWPAIGDLDSARAIPVSFDDYWSFDSINHVGAVLFDDPTLKTGNSDSPGEELFWMLGIDGLIRWQQMPNANPPSGLTLLEDSGYAIASDNRDWLLLDGGPIAAGLFPDATPSTAHGHADMMSVMYHSGGESLLDDGGMPYYGGDQDWVRFFRSPAAHNTVSIDGAEFVRRAGRLAWSHEAPRPELEAVETDGVWLMAAKLQWPDVTHERFVCCIPQTGLWIADLIRTDGPRRTNWNWQLPWDESMTLEGDVCSWQEMQIAFHGPNQQRNNELVLASETSPHGWRCFGYGQRTPGSMLTAYATINGSGLSLTALGRPQRPNVSVAVAGHEATDGFATGREPLRQYAIADCVWTIPESQASVPNE